MQKINVTFSFLNQDKLPLIIKPQQTKPASVNHLLQFLNQENKLFKEQLLQYGAVLFRDFQINSPEKFSNVIEACSLGDLFNYDFCTIPRTKIQKGIYTSINYTQNNIPMHNEKAYDYDTPSHIYFNCAQPSETGGLTPLINGNKLWLTLPERLKYKLENQGIMYRRYYYGEGIKLNLIRKISGGVHCRTWMEHFNTQEKNTVEDLLENTIYQHEWTKIGNGLITKKILPAFRKHPILDKIVWFNQCHNLNRYFNVSKDYAYMKLKNPIARSIMTQSKLLPLMACYGNGDHFSKNEIISINKLMHDSRVMTPWQKGDVMVIDNYSCLHGKTAHSGDRLILVGMTKNSSDIPPPHLEE